jgi:hypothetical protein
VHFKIDMIISIEYLNNLKDVVSKLVPNHEVRDIFIALTLEDNLFFLLHYDDRYEVLSEELEDFKLTYADAECIGPLEIDGRYLTACIGREGSCL